MQATDKIGDFMTSCPLTIQSKTTISEALKLMEDKDIRHLPVSEGERVIGLLSDREIKRYETLMDTTRTLAVDVMTQNPFTVKKDTPVREVVNTMAKNKYGSAVIVGHGGNIVGIFTTTDALDLFAKTIS